MRRRFVFRLARLLKVRRIDEKREIAKLAAAEAKLRSEQHTLDGMLRYEQELVAKLRLEVGAEIDVHERWQYERMLDRHRTTTIPAQRQCVQAAEQAVVQQQLALAEARKKVKVLEKLEEKQREEHRVELLHEEQVFLDDVAGQQFVRAEMEAQRRSAAAASTAEEVQP